LTRFLVMPISSTTKYQSEARILNTECENTDCTAGVDEVGVGSAAGPVVAAAVILKDEFDVKRITSRAGKLQDSKKMSKKNIPPVAAYIRKTSYVGIGWVSAKIIDRIGIRAATLKAMQSAVRQLAKRHRINNIIVDGIHEIPKVKNQTLVIKGDIIYSCVTAASIVAKAWRDRLMRRAAKKYPYYEFEKNAGYLTERHRMGIRNHGICAIHRESFLKQGTISGTKHKKSKAR